MDIMDALAGDGQDDGELKELKVKLPLRHHIKLHSLKLVKKEPISDTVLKALVDYFAKLEEKYASEHGVTLDAVHAVAASRDE